MDKKIIVDFAGHDQIRAQTVQQNLNSSSDGEKDKISTVWTYEVIGCLQLEKTLVNLQNQFGADIKLWQAPSGDDHVSILIRELIAKAKGEWVYPYEQSEICHCRSVQTETVDQAILAGAHTVGQIRRRTSASTACGTCQPDIEKILNYRLNR